MRHVIYKKRAGLARAEGPQPPPRAASPRALLAEMQRTVARVAPGAAGQESQVGITMPLGPPHRTASRPRCSTCLGLDRLAQDAALSRDRQQQFTPQKIRFVR